MSALTLTLREPSRGRLDLRGIVPDILLPMELPEIAALNITLHGQSRRLEELFEIEEGQRDRLVLRGELQTADHVGADMRDGMMLVEGSVGDGLARNMRGGLLSLHGDAGDLAASGLRGGNVTIAGNVGDYCAGAAPSGRRGMRGGFLHVSGSAGRFLGYRMRRGTVLICGEIDSGCASSLIAGTIVAMGPARPPLGVGMRRGTFLSLTELQPALHAGFTALEPIRLSYLQLLLDTLRPHLPHYPWDDAAQQPAHRSLGDRASGGIGEIIWIGRTTDE